MTAPSPHGAAGVGRGPRPGPTGAKGERTRSRILACALELFAESGFNAVSLRAIAARAGLTHVAVLRYFADRDELLLEALAHRDRAPLTRAFGEHGVLRPALRTPEGARRLLAATVVVARVNARERALVSLFTKVAAEATDPAHPAHAYFVDRYARLHELYAQALAVLLADVPGGARHDPGTVADQLVAVLDGAQLQWLLRPAAAPDPDALARPVLAFLASLGLEPDPDLVTAETARWTPTPTDGDPVDRAADAP